MPEDFSSGLLPALGTVLKRGPCGPSVQVRCAAFSMSMMVRGLPVLPSSMVSLPVRPIATRALAASHSASLDRSTINLPSKMTL